jgi:hypothetical protein
MEQWIPFVEGEYLVVQAVLASPDGLAVEMENARIKIFNNPRGKRSVRGSGMVRPAALVEMHETEEAVDLLLDLGNEFRYRMDNPVLKSGKVFAPDVRALLQFSPTRPWTEMTGEEFRRRLADVEFL